MHPRPSFRQALNRAVAERRLLVIPGAYDALSALLIERAGFDTMFIGGFPVAGARYGVPDIGLKGFADIATAVRDIIAACDVAILVDIDDGYGDVKNAVHTVQTYERMGASAVFLEDQAWPKRCGHMAGKKVVPAEVMEAKIKATMAERLDPETLICVRTDARAVLGFDEALRRAERYIRAGAEAIFVEAPESVDELERLARSFDVPQFANPLVGGRTPILSIKEFEQLGFNAICFGLETIMHAAKAMQAVLEDMRGGTFALRDKGMSFEEFKAVVHYDRWDRIDNLYGVPERPLPTGSTRRPTDAANSAG
jgi:2-methylisocitrate lyase-like PEP mutase family enzyme